MAKYLKLIVILILFLIILLTAYFIHWRYFELVHLKCSDTEIISADKKKSEFLKKVSKKTTLFITFDNAFYRVYQDEQYKKTLEERLIRDENDDFRLYKTLTAKYKNPASAYEIKIDNFSYQMDHIWKKPYHPIDLTVKYNCKKIQK